MDREITLGDFQRLRAFMAGSVRIDNMRKEIDFVVRALLGLIDIKLGEPNVEIQASDALWTLEFASRQGVSLTFKDEHGHEFYRSYSRGSKPHRIPAVWVEDIHEKLPYLLRGIEERFPGAKEKIAPFLEAGVWS